MTKQLGDYGHGTGRYQSEYQQLYDDLVPDSGHCETTAGELIRSAGRLSYDFYNNGMTNNTSGAVNFLRENKVINAKTYRTIHRASTGNYDEEEHPDSLRKAINKMMDDTVKFIIDNPSLKSEPNTVDNLDLSDPMVWETEYLAQRKPRL